MKKFVEGQWNPKGNLIAYLKSLKGILYGLFFNECAQNIKGMSNKYECTTSGVSKFVKSFQHWISKEKLIPTFFAGLINSVLKVFWKVVYSWVVSLHR